MMRPCTAPGCGELIAEGSRCDEHKITKASARTRGYSASWDKLSHRARTLQPFCTDCGATADLQLDHTPETWQRIAAGKPVRLEHTGGVVCGDCNRKRGAARGETPRRPHSGPGEHSKFRSQSGTLR